ncbi:MAG: hypothetical protein KGJ62_03410 [Armatimonadetes bacterium]|nr:hypothetical protein [Armatimonadota bacterium]MDE2205718.1 hypothetical protein [Armatimonadota bacterium]
MPFVESSPAAPARAQEPAVDAERDQRVSALTPRALLIGVVCVALSAVMVTFAELVVQQIQIGLLQIPPVAIGILLMLLVARAAARRFGGRDGLQRHELATIYIMSVIGAMVSSRGLLQRFLPTLTAADYYANGTNAWRPLLFKHIPRWAVPWDPSGGIDQPAVKAFYNGLRPGEHLPWTVWITPLLCWAVFLAMMLGCFLCIAALVRRQWVDNERLTFPLAQFPLELIGGEGSGRPLARNPAMWVGFALPALVFGFNGLHRAWPNIPDITTNFNLNALFTQPPFDAMTNFHAYISFAALGFFYMLPTDVLFSMWFFFLLTKVEEVLAASMGYSPAIMPLFACTEFTGYQNIGCYVALTVSMVWFARPHLANVWKACRTPLRSMRTGEGSTELLPYPAAVAGLALCFIGAVVWLWLLGMSPWLAAFELGLLFGLVAFVMARCVSEGGILMTETSFRPVDVYRMFGDVRNLSHSNLTGMAFLDAISMKDQRGLLLAGFLDSLKLTDGVRIKRGSLLGAFALAIGVACVVGGGLQIAVPYHIGAINMNNYVYAGNPVWSFRYSAQAMLHEQSPAGWSERLNFAGGFLATLAMNSLRSRFYWFPLNPIGYALSGTWVMMCFWFPALLAWLLKSLALRYGGMRFYRASRPLFLGMILGEVSAALFYAIPGLFNRYWPTPALPWP